MKKIMFNDRYGLTKAVLDGTKTMTRRIISDKQKEWLQFIDGKDPNDWIRHGAKYLLKETVAIAQSYEDIYHQGGPEYGSYELVNNYKRLHIRPWKDITQQAGWNNKMFVLADLMPHQIRITDIKVEQLQDISEEDCLKEGIQEYFPYIDRDPNDKVRTFRYFKDGKIRHCISPASKSFAYLIDDISGKGTWESNPYVFAYSFKLIK